MFLHIGAEVEISFRDIISIIDLEKSKSKILDEFLKNAYENKNIIKISNEQIKSIVIVNKKSNNILYLSPISTLTLIKRFNTIKSFFNYVDDF